MSGQTLAIPLPHTTSPRFVQPVLLSPTKKNFPLSSPSPETKRHLAASSPAKFNTRNASNFASSLLSTSCSNLKRPFEAIAEIHPAPFTILTFNILAPIWVSQKHYVNMQMSLFDRGQRIGKVVASIKEKDPNISFLQEVQRTEFEQFLSKEFEQNYYVHFSPNKPTCWQNWLDEEIPFEETGTAVLFKKNNFKDFKATPIEISDDGNHATLVTCNDLNGVPLIVVNSHLCSDNSKRRFQQISCIENAFKEKQRDFAHLGVKPVLIWGGDFNVRRETDEFKSILSGGWSDMIHQAGVHEMRTYHSAKGDAWTIDYIMVKGNYVASHAYVPNYPPEILVNEDVRVKCQWSVLTYGSDHLPVYLKADPHTK